MRLIVRILNSLPHNGGAHSAPARRGPRHAFFAWWGGTERSGPPPLVASSKRQATARSRRSALEFVRAKAEAWGPRGRLRQGFGEVSPELAGDARERRRKRPSRGSGRSPD